jgi:hypothetical protein
MAEEVKHTPGPWRIDSDKIEHGCCWDTAIVATVPKGQGNYGEDWSRIAECNDDNARLIAASPELLTALDGLLKRYVGLVESGDAGFWDAEEEEEVILARKVIAKAKGKF